MNLNLASGLVLLCAMALGCSGGGSSPGSPPPPLPPPAYVRGFSLSPQGFPQDFSKLPQFYAEVGGLGHGAALWNGAWRDDLANGADAGSVPAAAASVAQAGAANGFAPLSVFGWRSGTTLYIRVPQNSANNWSNLQARALYKQAAMAYATAYHPPFLFLGNENDFYFEQDPADYVNWIATYNETYAAVKAASPATLVGSVFSFEHLSGQGALVSPPWTAQRWGALDAHDQAKVDVVGITLYPWLSVPQPSQVPSGYLSPLFQRIGSKPIAITETGWPAENLGGLNPPWITTAQAQVDYIPVMFGLAQGHDLRAVVWDFLYAEADDGSHNIDWKLFGSVSLRDGAGNPRPAYDPWKAR